jgi:pSer/pThr/pTyr-binding forkhead associated (FHA) protein/S1-C subfamily serine protease
MILHDEQRRLDRPVVGGSARLGRDPSLDIPTDPAADVVSAVHARVWREPDGAWWLEDLGSTNGTWLRGSRIAGAERLHDGDRFTLGQRGPAFRVSIPDEVPRASAEPTADEQPVLRLRRVNGGADLIGFGRQILIGRASTCTIPLRTVADTLVSKRHAVVAFDAGGAATIVDLDSKNGTFINGQQIHGPAGLQAGDRVMLGWHGPLFEVRALGAASLPEDQGAELHPELQPPKTLTGMVQVAREEAGPGGFLRSLLRQMARESSAAFRVAAVALIVALSVGIVLVYRSAARESAAARARLASAEQAFAAQLKSASEGQRRADSDIARLRRDLAAAQRATVSRAVVDSLQTLLRQAERRAAASGADFSRVAAENQAAVGLVVARYPSDSVMGSGFVITRSGYLLTNGHVVDDPNRGRPRGIDVVMADTRTPLAAEVVAVSDIPDQDVAVLKIRDYRGAAVRAIDWQGRHVRQGEPAALIGFPRGTLLALDAAGFVRTTMFAGIIAKATGDWIQFAGSTDAGSSGSPLFNAAGEVIAMHYGAYAPPAPGQGASLLGFAIPIARARAWLPREARAELGL